MRSDEPVRRAPRCMHRDSPRREEAAPRARRKEVELMKAHYARFGDHLPREVAEHLATLERRLR